MDPPRENLSYYDVPFFLLQAEHLLYLNYCRRWPVYGATFFPGMLLTNVSVSDVSQSRRIQHARTQINLSCCDLWNEIITVVVLIRL